LSVQDQVSGAALAVRTLNLGGEHHRRQIARALDLSTTEFAVLIHLHSDVHVTPREVGHRLGITTGSTTAVLDRLERAGYLARTPNPGDRRSLFLSLTSRGQQAVDWAFAKHAEVVGSVLADFSSDDLRRLVIMLAAVERALDDQPRMLDRPHFAEPTEPAEIG
jgi:DNA-binding MarR family transcriptional regulator